MERWEEGYYITAMAGSATGSSLVVMSKGTPYTQQSYKVSGEHAGVAFGFGEGGCTGLLEAAEQTDVRAVHPVSAPN